MAPTPQTPENHQAAFAVMNEGRLSLERLKEIHPAASPRWCRVTQTFYCGCEQCRPRVRPA